MIGFPTRVEQCALAGISSDSSAARLDNAQPGEAKEGNLCEYSDSETLIGWFETSCVTITEYAMLIRTGYHILMIGLVGRAAHLPPTHTPQTY
jgi:hypothetical protein